MVRPGGNGNIRWNNNLPLYRRRTADYASQITFTPNRLSSFKGLTDAKEAPLFLDRAYRGNGTSIEAGGGSASRSRICARSGMVDKIDTADNREGHHRSHRTLASEGRRSCIDHRCACPAKYVWNRNYRNRPHAVRGIYARGIRGPASRYRRFAGFGLRERLQELAGCEGRHLHDQRREGD